MKMHFRKLSLKIVSCRDFITFQNNNFMCSLQKFINKKDDQNVTQDPKLSIKVLNKHALRKNRIFEKKRQL